MYKKVGTDMKNEQLEKINGKQNHFYLNNQ